MAINTGDRVKIHYRGRFQDGDEFDSSYERGEPLEFAAGSQELIPAMSHAVIGKSVGEKMVVEVPPNLGYGERAEAMVVEVKIDQLPDGVTVGTMLQLETPEGQVQVVVAEMHEDHAVLDGNHPLAGKHLVFDLEIVEVVAPA
jgi:FKBP-type peptidyl-prolyl cis-trans isomerase 2